MGKKLVYFFSNRLVKQNIKLGRTKIVPCQVCGKWGYDTGWCCPKCGWVQDFSLKDENDDIGLNDMSIREYKDYYNENKKEIIRKYHKNRLDIIGRINMGREWREYLKSLQ